MSTFDSVSTSTQTVTQNNEMPPSSEEHQQCMQAIRNLETNFIDKWQDTIKENFDLKLAMVQKDANILKKEKQLLEKENDRLLKENRKLTTELNAKTATNTNKPESDTKALHEKLHKLRTDLEQTAKDRHLKWQSEKQEILNKLSKPHSDTAELENKIHQKDEVIKSLHEKIEALEKKVERCRDEIYENKITQIAVETNNMTPVVRNKSSPADSIEVNRNQNSYANVASSTPRPHNPTPMQPQKDNRQNTTSNSENVTQMQPPKDNRQGTTDRKHKPSVKIVGNSQTKGLISQRLVPQANVNIETAYTLEEASRNIENMQYKPDVLVIHEITNDIKYHRPEAVANKLVQIASAHARHYPKTDVIVSLGTPRNDDMRLNTGVEICNAIINMTLSLVTFPTYDMWIIVTSSEAEAFRIIYLQMMDTICQIKGLVYWRQICVTRLNQCLKL